MSFVQRVMRLHEVAERNKRKTRPCERCGSKQVQIVDPFAQDWRCRECWHEWRVS